MVIIKIKTRRSLFIYNVGIFYFNNNYVSAEKCKCERSYQYLKCLLETTIDMYEMKKI